MSQAAGRKRPLTTDEKAAEQAKKKIKSAEVRFRCCVASICVLWIWMRQKATLTGHARVQEVLLHVRKLARLIEKEPKVARYAAQYPAHSFLWSHAQ
jgi:hypothetical protein